MIYEMLFPYQKNIVNTFKDRHKYGLFLDCGLGKTPVSLAFAEMHECTKVVVITLNSKVDETIEQRGSWFWWGAKSNIKYNFKNKKQLLAPTKKEQKILPKITNETNDMLLLNYESLYKRLPKNQEDSNSKKKVVCELRNELIDFAKSCKGHKVCIIVDESHKMKALNSLQTISICKLLKFCEGYAKAENVYTYLLTGTPFTKGFIDLYSQLKYLGSLMNKETFKENFCIIGHKPNLLDYQQPIVGYKNIDKLYELIHQFAITIKSNEVFKGENALPEQIFNYHITPLSKEISLFSHEKVKGDKIINELDFRGLENDLDIKKGKLQPNPFYRNFDYPSENYLCETSGQFWLRTRQLSVGFQGNAESYIWYNRDRLNELERLLANNDNNYLLFYNFTPELIEIFNICEKLGYNIDIYSGEIKQETFYNIYANQSEEERLVNTKNILLVNFASGSAAKNWQLYNQCIIFSLPLFKDWEQSLKRIHRIGQTKTCFYHIFMGDNFLDKKMLKSLREGTEYNKDMFDDDLERVQDLLNEGE